MFNDINWYQEITTASIPYAESYLKDNKNYFTQRTATKALADMIKHSNKPKIQKAIGNFAILKNKGYNIAQGIHETLNYDFKIKGLSTKVSVCDLVVLGKDLTGVWLSKDKNINKKINETSKSICKSMGGVIGANIGGAVGQMIGNMICPVVGGIVGKYLGTIGGSVLGSIAGGLIYDGVNSIVNKSIEFFSGIFGQFRSGGVEFSYPKEISGFKNNFSFDKYHFTAFEYESNKFEINDIVNLVNSKFLIDNIKIQNINEVYDTILKEIAYGFLYKKKLPSISLNFNKEGLLYSIMDDYYKNTITGNILIFLIII